MHEEVFSISHQTLHSRADVGLSTSHLLPRNYLAKTSLSRQQLIFSQELQLDLLKHKNITWVAQSHCVWELEYPYGPQISGATPTCPRSDLQAISSSDKVWSLQPCKRTDGNLLPQKFLAFFWKAVQPTPHQLAQRERAAWRVGHYRKLSHMSPFSNSNKLSIFSRKVGNLRVHVVPRKEGHTAPDIFLTACLRWNCDENKEWFTHHTLDFPVPKEEVKIPPTFLIPTMCPGFPLQTNGLAVQSAKHTILTPCSASPAHP